VAFIKLEFFTATRHRLQAIAQAVAIDQRKTHGRDRRKRKNRRRRRGEERLVEQNIENAEVGHDGL
jgi:hypothetical protein